MSEAPAPQPISVQVEHHDEVPKDQNLQLVTTIGRVVFVIAVALSIFQIYTAGLTAMTALLQRSIHLGAILCLTFLIHPPFKGARKDKFSIWLLLDLALVATSLYTICYLGFNMEEIFERQGDWLPADVAVGVIGVCLVLEACRRVIGNIMAGICLAFLLYAYFGRYMPDLIIHKGYSIERMSTTLWLTTEGVFGIPLGVAATFVFIFVLFGAFLESTGGGNFFINLAYALTGRFSGGPAKTAVVASGFMGSVSGSAVGNVVATGAFTIPMMKRVGYPAHVAGAVEAAASTGGQLMPPIMGAGAFLMAEFTNTSYLEIVKIALVPAILYYVTVLMFVHFEAQKLGLKGQNKDQLPRAWDVIKENLHFLIPVVILITALMSHVSPMRAGFLAVVSTYVASFVRKKSRLGFRQLLDTLELGAKNAVMVSVACAAAGIIVGMVSLTGLGLQFSHLVLELSMGNKALAILLIGAASLILGMGLPVTASYIVLVILGGPALQDLGVPIVVAHMIIFWYSQDSNVTPPVSLASFAAAGVAGANPMRTAFTSWKLAKGIYIIPLVMAYRPLLMNGEPFDVIMTMLCTLIGLIAFAACLDRYFLDHATWPEVLLLFCAATSLFWPGGWFDLVGLILFFAVVLKQWPRRAAARERMRPQASDQPAA